MLDFIFNLRILVHRKNKTRPNQIMPVEPVAVQKSEEKLASNTEVCGTIECSVLVGDQLACNQQLCHVKWSKDQASTPSAKLIYVQPCNSSVINKTCSGCRKLNCEECFQNQENEENKNHVMETQSEVKSTQFPEDNENICPLCSFKSIKVYKTTSVQTSEKHVIPESVLKPIQENIIARHVHSARSMERPSRDMNKLIQSSPVTPRANADQIMSCPKCRRRGVFMSKLTKKHLCPLCNQECTNKAICTDCYQDTPAIFVEEECDRKCSKLLIVNEMTQVSSKDFEEKLVCTKSHEDKVTQVSLNESLEERASSNQHKCCVCNKNKPEKIEKREIEIQVSLNEHKEECVSCKAIKLEEATNVSSKELKEEMLGKHSSNADRSYGDQNSANNESTQVSYSDILQEEASPKEDKLTQASLSDYQSNSSRFGRKLMPVFSRDFVQKERRPCGAADCQHPKCAKYNKPKEVEETIEMIVYPEKRSSDKEVETEEPSVEKVCPKNHSGKDCSCTVIKYIDEETSTDMFKQTSCQTTQSLEDTHPEASPTASGNESVRQDERKQMPLEEEQTPRNQELPKDLPECIDPKCTCIVNEKEILICTYCDSILSGTLPKSNKTLEVQTSGHTIEIPHKSGCTCDSTKCHCCKVLDAEELKELPQSSPNNQECFCIKTENGLLMCTYCKTMIQEQQGSSGGMDNPICSLSVSTCLLYQGRVQKPDQNKMNVTQTENTQHSTQTKKTCQTKTEKCYKKDCEDEDQKHKSMMEASEKNKNEVNEDDHASSTCSNEALSSDPETRVFHERYFTPAEMLYMKEREDMLYYLANKDTERYNSKPPPEPLKNVAVITLQKKIQVLEIESNEDSDAEEIADAAADNHDEFKERMKIVWEGLAENHAIYKDRIRKDLQSNIKFEDATKSLHDVSRQMVENNQSEIQNIYSCMIKNLLERQNQKENNLMLLEKLNCACDSSDAESPKHHTELPAVFQFAFPKYEDVETRECLRAKEDDDDVFLDIKETNSVKISSEVLLMSDNVSLSTITEEICNTPSDLISTSKESEQLQEKNNKEDDLSTTYCMQIAQPIVGQCEKLQKPCNQSCKRDTVFMPLMPCKFQREKKETENTPRKMIYSARCKNVSPKSCSARSDKCPRKSAGYFEPFMLSQTFGSTRTSFTTSDNEDNFKSLRSTTGSSVSFNLQEDQICNPIVEVCQSQSVPITSRASTPINEETRKVFYYGHSIPCTPKKLRWQDIDAQSNSLTDILQTPAAKCDGKTFRKESEYDEGNETPSMIIIKHFHPELYETDGKKIVPPLPIVDLTPEHSETEESRPISCSSHLSAKRTRQTIENYNLECNSPTKNNPKRIHLQEMKQSKKSSFRTKSQPQSTRAHPIVGKSIIRKQQVGKFNVEPIIRERRVSAPSSHRKKPSSPKLPKVKSSTSRIFRPKTTTLSPYKNTEKRKSSKKSSGRKSRLKSEPASPEREHNVCHCELYKTSRNNYCRIHGIGAHWKNQSVTGTHGKKSDPMPGCSRSHTPTTPTIKSTVNSPKRRSMTPKMNTSFERRKSSSSERPKTSVEKTKTLQGSPKNVAKSGEPSPKTHNINT